MSKFDYTDVLAWVINIALWLFQPQFVLAFILAHWLPVTLAVIVVLLVILVVQQRKIINSLD